MITLSILPKWSSSPNFSILTVLSSPSPTILYSALLLTKFYPRDHCPYYPSLSYTITRIATFFHPLSLSYLSSSPKTTTLLFSPTISTIVLSLSHTLTHQVYPNGEVCISILHAPGDDPSSYEHSSERWSPVQSVEKILISVMSMLSGTPSPPKMT